MLGVTHEYFQLVRNYSQAVYFSCHMSPTRELSPNFLKARSITHTFCKLGHELYCIWEKQLTRLAGRHFSCHITHHFNPKLVLQIVQTTELLMLVLDFVVNSRLKILNGISVESMECSNKDV